MELAEPEFSKSYISHVDLYTAFHSKYHAQQLEHRYGVDPAKGYCFVMPEFQDRSWDEFIDDFGSQYGVFPLHHLHYGLWFPVH